jgi:hypothetical protein
VLKKEEDMGEARSGRVTAPTETNGAPTSPLLGMDPEAEKLEEQREADERAAELEEVRAEAERKASERRKPADDEETLPPAEAAASLDLMLSAEDVPPPPTEVFEMAELAARLGAESFTVELRALSEPELEAIGRRSERRPTAEERERGVLRPRDMSIMWATTVSEAMVTPDLTNSSLLQKYGPTPRHVVQRWFLPGEIQKLAEAVTDLTGWSEGSVARAKKS